MQISQSKLVFKVVLVSGLMLSVFIAWILISLVYEQLRAEQQLNQFNRLFQGVQHTYTTIVTQEKGLAEYTLAVKKLQRYLSDHQGQNSSLFSQRLVNQVDLQVVLLASESTTSNDFSKLPQASKNTRFLQLTQGNNALAETFAQQFSQTPTAEQPLDVRWLSLLLVALLLWGALLYCLYRKLSQGIALTEQVLSDVKGLQSYRLPEHCKGQLVAEPQLQELLEFTNVLATRLDQVHARFIEEAQEATLGSMVQGFSKSLQHTVEHAATHQKRLNTIVNKLTCGQANEGQVSQLLTKSQQILTQLDVDLANIYDLLADFEHISNYQQFDVVVGFNLKQLVENVFARHSTELITEQFQVSYEIPDTLQLQSYPAVFEQVCHHCISNSVKHAKHTDKPLHIVVSAMVVNDFVHLYFKDDGVGIDSELLPILAQPSLNSRQHFGKLGLGLSVIYHLVTDKLKGELKVQSPAHGGACIHIVLANTLFSQSPTVRTSYRKKYNESKAP
ncbi:hypothetical protein PSECIP111854_01713 [Pseudoalteromonas sp. CIP111854]|uniref:histidine kinase n=1 Tax=Pseudoalteromonas holothuriae TaxID=2963714 RepID=A0A9W4W394_9GAMM|nr:HAMP domain-containing sensor histidine kinase [Pseudoalteromonas sp. CIP111854]CAH9056051.1 hypothetical protein PSECIP111854_01713 [Pseudoalteromonas sp. CIP111854]